MKVCNWTCLNVLVLGLLLCGTNAARAADDKKDDPTGTWSWTVKTQNGDEFKITMKLKKEGDKVTGTVNFRDTDVKIEDGQFKDGTLTFKVSPEFNGNKINVKYNGKVSGDTIKGKSEMERDGQTRSRDWEAKRDKES